MIRRSDKGQTDSVRAGKSSELAQTCSGPVTPDMPISVSVITRRKKPLNLDALGGRVLSREEFESNYAADPVDFAALRDFARTHHLTIDEDASSLARRTLVMRGAASAMEQAFGVRLLACPSPGSDLCFHTPDGPIHLPAAYQDMIETVLGLDTRPVATSHGGIGG